MPTHVIRLVASRIEPLAAQVTAVGLTVIVDPHVDIKVPFLGEEFVTDIALELLDPLMRILVVLVEILSPG
jgi:hypothetical protein